MLCKVFIVFFAIFCFNIKSACAFGGLTVFDPTAAINMAKQFKEDVAQKAIMIKQLEEQVNSVKNQIEQIKHAKDQIERLQTQIESINGARDIADIYNTITDIEDRIFTEDLDHIFDIIERKTVSKKNKALSEFVEEEKIAVFDGDNLEQALKSDNVSMRSTAKSATSSLGLLGYSDVTLKNSVAATKRIGLLIDLTKTETPDLKASVDLNTRVSAEVAFLLSQSLALQAAQADAVARHQIAMGADRLDGLSYTNYGN